MIINVLEFCDAVLFNPETETQRKVFSDRQREDATSVNGGCRKLAAEAVLELDRKVFIFPSMFENFIE